MPHPLEDQDKAQEEYVREQMDSHRMAFSKQEATGASLRNGKTIGEILDEKDAQIIYLKNKLSGHKQWKSRVKQAARWHGETYLDKIANGEEQPGPNKNLLLGLQAAIDAPVEEIAPVSSEA